MSNKQFLIYVNNIPVEVTKENYREYWKCVEQKRYMTKKIKKTWIYLDQLFDKYDQNSLEFQLIDDINSVETIVYKKELIKELLNEIQKLSKEEQELIQAIYFDELTDREYAKLTHQNQTTVSKRHRKILKKLRKRLK